MVAVTPVSGTDLARVVEALAAPDFQAAARRLTELTRSSYRYEPDSGTLIFASSGDRASIDDIDIIKWNEPAALPASDINRCYFISFAEFAPLVEATPAADLDFIHRYLQRLEAFARLGGPNLTIPWGPISAARRLVNVLAGLSLILAKDRSLGSDPRIGSIIDHVRRLANIIAQLREDDLGYNHQATEIFAQCVYAHVFTDTTTRADFSRQLLDAINQQIEPDGFHSERSATYHAHVLGHLDVLMTGRLLSPEPALTALGDIVSRMRSAMAIATHPDGSIVLFNDCAVGDGPSPEVLKAWPSAIPDGTTLLPQTGIARLQQGDFVALFDVGPCGPEDNPGHAHADFLSFELSVGGRRFIVDPGVASYKSGPERDWSRSAATHNGPAFTGIEPIEFVGAFRIGRRGHAYWLDTDAFPAVRNAATATGYQDGFDHLGGRVGRHISVASDAMHVVDAWIGAIGPPATAYLVPSSWKLVQATTSQISFVNEVNEIVTVTASSGTLAVESTAYYFPLGPRKPEKAHKIVVKPLQLAGDRHYSTISISTRSEPILEAAMSPAMQQQIDLFANQVKNAK